MLDQVRIGATSTGRLIIRILHLDPDDIANPLSGGGPLRTFEVNRRLAKRHEITVLTPTFPGSTAELVRENIRYIRLGRKIGNHGSSHHITFFFALPWAVLRRQFDLLVEDFMPPVSTSFSTLFTSKPVVASVQWFNGRELARQYKLPFQHVERNSLRLYRNLVVMTPSMRKHILSVTPKANVAVIPNGVSPDLFDVPVTVGNTILYFGRVDMEQKGIRHLMLAYARLPERLRLPLVIAGFGWEWDVFNRLAAELGIASTLRVVGRIDAGQRRILLQECRFVCFPSPAETFGLGIVEACAAGKPVIHFDLPPMNEVAAGAGCIAVPAFDIDAYSAAMAFFVTATPDEMEQRGRACRNRVSAYQWDETARMQEAFYEQAVADARGRKSVRSVRVGSAADRG